MLDPFRPRRWAFWIVSPIRAPHFNPGRARGGYLGVRRRPDQPSALGPTPLANSSALVCAADARIDNRDDLARWLGIERGEPAMRSFSFAAFNNGASSWPPGVWKAILLSLIWDEATRSLYAARDPFGIRPLFFRRLPA